MMGALVLPVALSSWRKARKASKLSSPMRSRCCDGGAEALDFRKSHKKEKISSSFLLSNASPRLRPNLINKILVVESIICVTRGGAITTKAWSLPSITENELNIVDNARTRSILFANSSQLLRLQQRMFGSIVTSCHRLHWTMMSY